MDEEHSKARPAAAWAKEIALPEHVLEAVLALRGWSRATVVTRPTFEDAVAVLDRGAWG